MAEINNVLKALAGSAQELHAKTEALDMLLRGLYFERAVEKRLFLTEAEDEILSLIDGVDAASDGPDESIKAFRAGVRKALGDFGRELRELLEASQHRPE